MLSTYHIWTIGCQMNAADSRAVADALEARGLRPVAAPADADLILLNTCVVRASAENKALGRLSSLRPLKARRPDLILAVMGCLVGADDAELRRQFPYVDLFLRPSHPEPLLALLDSQPACGRRPLHDLPPSPVAAFVPISYGCDHACTYCIVRLRRGPQQSRPIADVVSEVAGLVARGARDVTLLGQNVDAYGRDLASRPDLADLLAAVHDTPGLLRLRFLTSHPSDMSERIIETAARLPRVCRHIELPVQAGSDAVLRRMGRGYSAAQYLDLVERIRAAMPDVSLGTDVIVGFCGESDADYTATRALIELVRFDVVHIAAYSARAGTPAERLADDVPPAVKEARRKDLEALQTRIAGEINAALLGQTVEVLVEGHALKGSPRGGRQEGRWYGRTPHMKLVYFADAGEDDLTGRLVPVRITWAGPWSLIGESKRAQ